MSQSRSPAVKMLIAELLAAQLFSEDDGRTLALVRGQKAERANVVATLIAKEDSASSEYALVDDTTGRIGVRNFDERRFFASIPLGMVVQLVCRINEFNRQPFLVPEIVRPLDPSWLRLRLQEIPFDAKAPAVAAEGGAASAASPPASLQARRHPSKMRKAQKTASSRSSASTTMAKGSSSRTSSPQASATAMRGSSSSR